MKFKELKAKHPTFNEQRLFMNDLLYEGGPEIMNNAELFLGQKQEDESEAFYAERMLTAYDPIYANTLNRLKALLFSKPLQVMPTQSGGNDGQVKQSSDEDGYSNPTQNEDPEVKQILQDFQSDCDGLGTPLNTFMAEDLICAMKNEYTLTLIDFPQPVDLPAGASKGDQKALGLLRPIIKRLCLSKVINWQKDDQGEFIWIVFFDPQMGFVEQPGDPTLDIYKWTIIGFPKDSDTIVFKDYIRTYNRSADQFPTDEDDIPGMPDRTTTFTESNIVEFNLGCALALGNVIGPHCEQLYRTDALCSATAQRNCFALPWVATTMGLPGAGADGRRAIGPNVMGQEDLDNSPTGYSRQDGILVLQKGSQAGMLEVQGKALEALQAQRTTVRESINIAVHQVSQNIRSMKQALSAAAKEEDKKDTEIILNEFKSAFELYLISIFDKIFTFLGKPDVALQMEGLNTEDDADRTMVLQMVQAYGQFPQAELFKIHFEYNNALALLGGDLSDNDKQDLLEQTIQAVQKSTELGLKPGQTENDLKAEQAKNAPSGSGTPSSSPSGKSPSAASATTSDPPEIDKNNGAQVAPPTAHLQTGQHIDPSVVYDMLEEDYKPKDIAWVKTVAWQGPLSVPLDSIDFSDVKNWSASKELDKVQDMAKAIKEDNWNKPSVFANEVSNNNKMAVLDGHHRVLAYQSLNLPVPAYVAQVGKVTKEMKGMHSMQKDGGDNTIKSQQIESKQKDNNG